jgi:hypothetical protein
VSFAKDFLFAFCEIVAFLKEKRLIFMRKRLIFEHNTFIKKIKTIKNQYLSKLLLILKKERK